MLRKRRVLRRLQQRGFERRRRQVFEIAAAEFRIRVFAGDDLALFGDADRTLHRPGRLGEDRLIARPTAAPNRAAAAVKQAQTDAMAPKYFDERDLGLVQLPTRG